MVRSGGRWSGGGSLRVASRNERCSRSRWKGFLLVDSSAGLPSGDGVSSFLLVSVVSVWAGGPLEDLPQPAPPRPSKPVTASQTRLNGMNPSPQPPPRSGEGEQKKSCSPSPLRGGGWGEGLAPIVPSRLRRRVIALLLPAGWWSSFPLRGGVCSLAPFRRQPRLPARRGRIDPVPSRPLE